MVVQENPWTCFFIAWMTAMVLGGLARGVRS